MLVILLFALFCIFSKSSFYLAGRELFVVRLRLRTSILPPIVFAVCRSMLHPSELFCARALSCRASPPSPPPPSPPPIYSFFSPEILLARMRSSSVSHIDRCFLVHGPGMPELLKMKYFNCKCSTFCRYPLSHDIKF